MKYIAAVFVFLLAFLLFFFSPGNPANTTLHVPGWLRHPSTVSTEGAMIDQQIFSVLTYNIPNLNISFNILEIHAAPPTLQCAFSFWIHGHMSHREKTDGSRGASIWHTQKYPIPAAARKLLGWVHTAQRSGSQQACILVHCFRSDFSPNFGLKSDLKRTKRHAGLLCKLAAEPLQRCVNRLHRERVTNSCYCELDAGNQHQIPNRVNPAVQAVHTLYATQ